MFEVTVRENKKYEDETFEFDTFEEVGEFWKEVVSVEGSDAQILVRFAPRTRVNAELE